MGKVIIGAGTCRKGEKDLFKYDGGGSGAHLPGGESEGKFGEGGLYVKGGGDHQLNAGGCSFQDGGGSTDLINAETCNHLPGEEEDNYIPGDQTKFHAGAGTLDKGEKDLFESGIMTKDSIDYIEAGERDDD